MSARRVLAIAWPVLPLVILVALPFNGLNGYLLALLYYTFTYAAMSVGWNIIGGYTGYISLANLGFFGLGSYVAGLMLTHLGWPILLTSPLVGIICALVAAAIGWVALRTRGPSFVIVTLAFTFIVQFLALNLKGITGGSAGLYLPLLTMDPLLLGDLFYYYMLGVLVLAIAVAIGIRRSRFGLGLIAIREDEGKAEGSGVNTSLFKIVAFMISAWFAAVAGAIHAQYLNYVDPDLAFELIIMLYMIVMTLLGSRGTVWGPVLGAFLLFPLQESLVYWVPPAIAGEVHLALLGVVLVLVARFMPNGLLVTVQNLIGRPPPPRWEPVPVVAGEPTPARAGRDE
ncbi:MAG TPA: branched-chain amino acid ABC transporter permease [Candidatus Dormibacteraeota bacterium]|nr:branched-chain amino acid ABC transporter permease [Candidatus Dormibacteraeota bacterium]